MRDIETTGPNWRTVEGYSAKRYLLIVFTVAVVVGLTIGPMGVAASGDDATLQATEHDALLITDECEDEAGTVTIENPNSEAANLTMNWTVDQQTLQLQVADADENRNQTQTLELSPSDATVETTQVLETETGERVLTAELTSETLNVTVPADEELTISGLADDTYAFSAAIDDREVPVDPSEVTIECATETPTSDAKQEDTAPKHDREPMEADQGDEETVKEKDEREDKDRKDGEIDRKDEKKDREEDKDRKDEKKERKEDKKDRGQEDETKDRKEDKKDEDRKNEKKAHK